MPGGCSPDRRYVGDWPTKVSPKIGRPRSENLGELRLWESQSCLVRGRPNYLMTAPEAPA